MIDTKPNVGFKVGINSCCRTVTIAMAGRQALCPNVPWYASLLFRTAFLSVDKAQYLYSRSRSTQHQNQPTNLPRYQVAKRSKYYLWGDRRAGWHTKTGGEPGVEDVLPKLRPFAKNTPSAGVGSSGNNLDWVPCGGECGHMRANWESYWGGEGASLGLGCCA